MPRTLMKGARSAAGGHDGGEGGGGQHLQGLRDALLLRLSACLFVLQCMKDCMFLKIGHDGDEGGGGLHLQGMQDALPQQELDCVFILQCMSKSFHSLDAEFVSDLHGNSQRPELQVVQGLDAAFVPFCVAQTKRVPIYSN